MGGEGFFLMAGAMILWGLIGLVAAFTIQQIWRLEEYPFWVAFWCFGIGSFATVAWSLPAVPG